MSLTRTMGFRALLLAVVLSLWAGRGEAAELEVLSAGAMRSIVTELAAAFEKETGNPVKLTFGTVGAIKAKLADGAPADVVIMTDEAMKEMARQGAVVEGSWTAIGRTGIGVAVRDGAPKPDIGSPEALKQALLSTKSLVYIDPAQGGKTTLVPGGYPAELVAKGDVEMVVHQISEIIPVKGVTLVGPLPKELQKITVYAAGVTIASASPPTSRAFVAFLARPAFKPKLAAAGLDYKE